MLRNRLKFNYTLELIIFILLIVIQFAFLNASLVCAQDEYKYAQAAREMFVGGNYWFPTFNGSFFVDKPPMQYFFMMLGFKFFGINAFGARFFSALLGCLTVFITYKFSQDYFGKKTARTTLIVMVSACSYVPNLYGSILIRNRFGSMILISLVSLLPLNQDFISF